MRRRKTRKRKSASHLKLVRTQYTLSYGMRLDRGVRPEEGHRHVPVRLPDGSEGEMTIHLISGSREEIRARLLHSIEAFFEIYDEERYPRA